MAMTMRMLIAILKVLGTELIFWIRSGRKKLRVDTLKEKGATADAVTP